MAAGLAQSLLEDLYSFLDVMELLAVPLDLVLDVGKRASRVCLQFFQHALLSLPQEAMQPLEGITDCGAEALC